MHRSCYKRTSHALVAEGLHIFSMNVSIIPLMVQGPGRRGQDRAGQAEGRMRAGQGRAGQGRTSMGVGQGRAAQGRAA